MDDAKRKRLEAAGYTVGNAVDILGIPPARKALIEFRISASLAVRRLRAGRGLTQAEAGKLAGVAQAQVARIEGVGADDEAKGGTSTDLILKLLFSLGGTVADLKPVLEWKPQPEAEPIPRRGTENRGIHAPLGRRKHLPSIAGASRVKAAARDGAIRAKTEDEPARPKQRPVRKPGGGS